ncbi:MAG TPA: ATP-binding protein [Clostridia bacterium]|nr:ATP-binding protein [Clostridia bacterium]
MDTIERPALMENLEEVLDFVNLGLKSKIDDKKLLYQIRLVCEEIIVNVINYAYPGSTGNVRVSYSIPEEGKELEIVVCDSGIPFDPLAKDDPDINLPLNERKIGGLGIFMVRQSMDEVSYKRENGMNILTLKKAY